MSKKAIVAELNQRSLTVVELAARRTGIEIVRYAVREVPPEGASSEWLRAVWTKENFSHNQIICSLPGFLTKFKSVYVPVLPQEQLTAAVQLELETSGTRGDIYHILSYQPQDQMILVKVVVVRNEELSAHLQIFQQAGLEVSWSGLKTRGIQNFINFNRDCLGDQPTDAAYLDLGCDKTEFGVLLNQEVVYRRDFSPGTDELALGVGDSVIDFLEEVRLSVASFTAGTGFLLPSLIWAFGRVEEGNFTVREILQPDLAIKIPDNTRLLGVIVARRHLPQVAPLLGLALDEFGYFDQLGIQLYSYEQTIARQKRQWVLGFVKLAGAALILMGGILLTVQAEIVKNQKTGHWLQSKSEVIARLQQVELETSRNQTQYQTLEEWLNGSARELEFLKLFQENLPDGTRIADIIIEDGVIKDISGVTPVVSLMLNKLRSVPGLESLKLKGTISITDEGEMFHLEGPIVRKEAGR